MKNNIIKSAKGARLERSVAKILVWMGYSVVRGAGSKSYGKGKIDLVAINPEKKQIYLIQCKNFKKGAFSAGKKETEELFTLFNSDEKYNLQCALITKVGDLVFLGAN